MLRQGYAVASSSLNVFGNNCQDLLAAESLMMVKERFIENFGVPAFTIGFGCSGGSEQAHPISDDYPGLFDGIIVGCSFPEVFGAFVLNLTDADLFYHYAQGPGLTWTADQQNAVTGYPTATTPATLSALAVRIKAQGGTCNAAIPANTRFDQVTNPQGVRCDVYDHTVNVFGRDPSRVNTDLDRYQAVTPDDVLRVAQKYLGRGRVRLVVSPKAPTAPAQVEVDRTQHKDYCFGKQ